MAGDAFIAHVDHVDAHLGNNTQQAHQLAGAIVQARVNHEITTGDGQAVLDKAAHQVDIDIATCEGRQHLLALELDRPLNNAATPTAPAPSTSILLRSSSSST